MPYQNSEFQSLVERVAKLERQNKTLKRIGAVAIVVVGILVLTGQAEQKGRIVEGNEFLLKDTGGTVRARLAVGPFGGGNLELYDAQGVTRASMGDLGLELSDITENSAIIVAPDPTSALMSGSWFTARHPNSEVVVLHHAGLTFQDKAGKVIWRAP
jgi:hypothetical protein